MTSVVNFYTQWSRGVDVKKESSLRQLGHKKTKADTAVCPGGNDTGISVKWFIKTRNRLRPMFCQSRAHSLWETCLAAFQRREEQLLETTTTAEGVFSLTFWHFEAAGAGEQVSWLNNLLLVWFLLLLFIQSLGVLRSLSRFLVDLDGVKRRGGVVDEEEEKHSLQGPAEALNNDWSKVEPLMFSQEPTGPPERQAENMDRLCDWNCYLTRSLKCCSSGPTGMVQVWNVCIWTEGSGWSVLQSPLSSLGVLGRTQNTPPCLPQPQLQSVKPF